MYCILALEPVTSQRSYYWALFLNRIHYSLPWQLWESVHMWTCMCRGACVCKSGIGWSYSTCLHVSFWGSFTETGVIMYPHDLSASISCLCSLYPAIYVGAGDLNLGPQVCARGTFCLSLLPSLASWLNRDAQHQGVTLDAASISVHPHLLASCMFPCIKIWVLWEIQTHSHLAHWVFAEWTFMRARVFPFSLPIPRWHWDLF